MDTDAYLKSTKGDKNNQFNFNTVLGGQTALTGGMGDNYPTVYGFNEPAAGTATNVDIVIFPVQIKMQHY